MLFGQRHKVGRLERLFKFSQCPVSQLGDHTVVVVFGHRSWAFFFFLFWIIALAVVSTISPLTFLAISSKGVFWLIAPSAI